MMFDGVHVLMPPGDGSEKPYLLKNGIDYGPKPPRVLLRKGNYALIKQPGHMGWIHRGASGWHPAQYHVVECQEEKAPKGAQVFDTYRYRPAKTTLDIKRIVHSEEPGSKWKTCLKELTAMVERLSLGKK